MSSPRLRTVDLISWGKFLMRMFSTLSFRRSTSRSGALAAAGLFFLVVIGATPAAERSAPAGSAPKTRGKKAQATTVARSGASQPAPAKDLALLAARLETGEFG